MLSKIRFHYKNTPSGPNYEQEVPKNGDQKLSALYKITQEFLCLNNVGGLPYINNIIRVNEALKTKVIALLFFCLIAYNLC